MRKVISFIVFLLFVYGIYVTIDCIRLKNATDFTKPFLIIGSEDTKEEMSFTGLGYKVIYKVKRTKQAADLELVTATEGTCTLFNTFTLWTKNYSEES